MTTAMPHMGSDMSQEVPRWQHLAGEAKAGRLRLDPDIAPELVRACDDRLGVLDDALHRANYLTKVAGFGELASGLALEGKFSSKGDELIDVLRQHIRVVNDMKAVFLYSIGKYEEADASHAAALGPVGPQ